MIASLIDRHLPVWHFRERHEVRIAATPARVLEAVAAYDLQSDPIIGAMTALREAPGRLWRRSGGLSGRPRFGLVDFVPLGRDGHREIAYGLAGRFWRLDYGLIRVADADSFAALPAETVPKLVLTFMAEPEGPATRLATETRIRCDDAGSRRWLRLYWLAIRPGSGFIRRRILASIRRAAEAGG